MVERRLMPIAFLGAVLASMLALSVLAFNPISGVGGAPPADGELGVDRDYANLPLAFEPNRGQADGRGEFVARGTGYSLALAPDSAMLAVSQGDRGLALDMKLPGADPRAQAEPLSRLPGEVNYLVGERPDWRTGVPTYERVRYHDAWPGIDVDYYGNRGRLEYDFRLAPGADPAPIALRFSGQERLRLAANGDLVLSSPTGDLRQRAPVAYQRIGGERVAVDSAYVLPGERTVGIRLGAYDSSRPLVIDPLLLTYSTFVGGAANDFARALAVDGSGAVYLFGEAEAGYPTTPGAFDTTHNGGGTDVFVTKLNPAGSALAYSTFIGGSGADLGFGVAVGGDGSAYVTGQTADAATDYPTTAGAFDTTQNGLSDVFLTKLNPAGSALTYSTFLGGSSSDIGNAVAVGSDGSAYVTGRTPDATTDYPATSGSFDLTHNGIIDAFATKVNPAGSALSYSTFLGGSGSDTGSGIAVAADGTAYATGVTEDAGTDYPTTAGAFDLTHNGLNDAFVTKLNATGSALGYSTLLGGAGNDTGTGAAVNGSGAAYVTGVTADAATDFPTKAGSFDTTHNGNNDAFVTKLDPAGGALAYSTFLGGSFGDDGGAIAVDGSGAAHVTGGTDDAATDFPTTPGAFDTTHNGPNAQPDAFVTKLSPTGDGLESSSFLGGGSADVGLGIGLDGSGAVYVAGIVFPDANPFPTTPGAYDTIHNSARDGFVTKFSPPALAISNAAVLEGDAGEQSAVVQVTMDLPNDSPVKVDYATENGSAQAPGDYAATSGTVTFQPGQTSKRVEVSIADDALDERVETLRVRITNARYAPIEDAVGVVTITDDDDPPALRVNDRSITEGNAGTKNLRFIISLEQPSGKTVRASFETDDGTATAPGDFTHTSGLTTFGPGVTSRPVDVPIVGDTAVEATETLRLLITGTENAQLLDSLGRGTILDND
jgi:hypothetical protein